MLLEVDDIHVSYGKFDVLRGVSLFVNEGEIVCMIGPNGAGKSTVFRSISGFLKPHQGSIRFDGENITGLSPVESLKRGISYVFQRHSLFPKMTVMENMQMGAFIRQDDEQIKQDIENICEIFPIIRERRNKKAETLSGGERRMVEIGRALLLHPKLLLLDEPSLGLAPNFVDVVFEKIEDVHERGTTIMIVEQNAKRALQVSDRAYVLELGRNRFEGASEEILKNEEVKMLYLGGK